MKIRFPSYPLLLSLITALLLSLATPTYAAPTSQQVTGTATVLQTSNLRAGPGTNFAVAGSAQQGNALTIVGCNSACDWYQLTNGNWIAAFLVDFNPATSNTSATPITVIGWNTELNGADVQVIADRLAGFQDVDLWGLAEVNRASSVPMLEAGAEEGENADYASILSDSGGGDRLLAIYDTTRFDLLDSWEENDINTTGNARAPLVLHLREKATSTTFLFMVNHLYRSRDDERHKQAQMLNEWAAQQVLPVIAVGDYNFDWDITAGQQNHDAGYDLMTANNRFRWVQPSTIVTTQCSGWPCQFNSVLDFVFTAGPAQQWRATAEIVVVAGDFPDTATTSDHRPMLAQFWPTDIVRSPLPQATPTVASVPASPLASSNANLRSGPGTTYALAGSVQQGQTLRITGRNQSGDWYQIDSGVWIAAFLVSGAPSGTGLPVIEAPAALPQPPTATPVPQQVEQPTATSVPQQVEPPTATPAPQPAANVSANCDPSYPGVCIPPRPPDLDCGEIPYRRFTVIGADPHGFDGDNDGIGCER